MTYSSILLQAQKIVRHPEKPGAAGRYRHPRLSVVERSWPTLSPGQVLLKVCYVSICGTDIHVMQTDADGYSCSSAPASNWERGIQFGHELAAQVVAVGPGVREFQVGDYVTADSLVPCRSPNCQMCRTQQWNACPQAYLLGLQADGVFGEFAVAPAASIHSIDPLIRRYGLARALRTASLAEPLGVALHSFSQARRWLRKDDPDALVLGAGPLGLFFAWRARLGKSRRVVILEPNPRRADYARQFADLVVHPDDFDPQLSRDAFGKGPDVVFDTCGRADMDKIMAALAPGGAIVTGARTGNRYCFNTDRLITNGQAIIGARGHVGQVPQAIEMLANGEADPEMFITRALEGIPQLLAAFGNSQQLTDELKVICWISSPDRQSCC